MVLQSEAPREVAGPHVRPVSGVAMVVRFLAGSIGVAALLAVVAVLIVRWRQVDNLWEIGLAGMTPFMVGPLVLGVLGAAVSRSRVLLAMALLTGAVFVATVAPLDAAVGCGPGDGSGGITVYTANVQGSRGDSSRFGPAVDAAQPDVIVMQEVRSSFLTDLAGQPAMDRYPHRSSDLQYEVQHLEIWSRWPLTNLQTGWHDADTIALHAVVERPEAPFELTAIHVTSPTTAELVVKWGRQLDHLATWNTDRPRILAGDFNATEDHRPFRRLLASGWTDVHDDRGCGLDATWPEGRIPFPALRLDHVLVTDRFEVVSTSVGDAAGSDHRPVITTVRQAGGS